MADEQEPSAGIDDSTRTVDLVIIGAGAAGLAAAEFAVGLDLDVLVVERHRVGGSSLWGGSVPSKALIASARVAHEIRHADRFGLPAAEPGIDLAAVWRRVRAVRDDVVASGADEHRLVDLGIEVMIGDAAVTGPTEVTVDGDHVISARFILVCTGSHPVVPSFTGDGVRDVITSDTLFDLDTPPSSLVVVGGGPVGVEMAQAFVRLGIRTTLVQRGPRLLPKDEPSLVASLTAALLDEGLDLRVGADIVGVRRVDDGHLTVTAMIAGDELEIPTEGVFVAVGRRPSIAGLGLEALDIEVGPRGVGADGRGRTAQRTVYAVGDVTGGHLHSHLAADDAIRAVRDMFIPGKVSTNDLVPWCTFTQPELAHVGVTSDEADDRFGEDAEVWKIDFGRNDRARADDAGDGAIMLVTAKERIVGAHVLAPAAGEMIHELALAIRHEMKLSDIASLVHVHPTFSSSIGVLAGESGVERAQKFRWMLKRRG